MKGKARRQRVEESGKRNSGKGYKRQKWVEAEEGTEASRSMSG